MLLRSLTISPFYGLLCSGLETREDDDDDQDGLLAQADMRTDLVRPSGSAERDGTVPAELNQVNDEFAFICLSLELISSRR